MTLAFDAMSVLAMPSSVRAVQYAFVFAWLAGIYLTWYLIAENGTAAMVDQLQLSDPPSLPNGGPLRVHYTGLQPLDRHLSALAILFWPILDGSMPNLSLDALNFTGQIVAL